MLKKVHMLGWLLTLVLLVGMLPTGFAGAQEVDASLSLREEASPAANENTDGIAQTPLEAETQRALANAEIGIQEGTKAVVGATTTMTGEFGLGLWGDNASDSDVRELLHGYETVSWTRSLGMRVNETVVASVDGMENGDGSQVFTVQIVEGLTYNDGTPITAKDYVFSLLLLTSPQLQELGGIYGGMEHLVGYEAYHGGKSQVLKGVRLLSDWEFSLHVKKEYLPYYFGINLLNVQPYPIDVIAPGCDVMDDGDGVYLATIAGIAPEEMEQGYVYGEFSTEMLRYTLLDPETGYEYFPRRTCGPYRLEGYDAAKQEASFSANEYFAGNYQGQKPHIEQLVFKKVDKDTMLGELESGELDVLARVSESEIISGARALQSSGVNMKAASYPRSGLAFLAFACESGPTASEAVRQAISVSFDKDSLVRDAVGSHAVAAYGYYGIGQWMTEYVVEPPEEPVDTGEAEDAEAGEETAEEATPEVVLDPINMPEELAALRTSKNVAQAKALLDGDGWNLNQDGQAFQDGVDAVRYRQEGKELVPLTIRWALSEESAVAAALQEPLVEAMQAVGMDVQVTVMPFDEMLGYYYRAEDRKYNMFFVASNFSFLFDPYYDFSTDDAYQGVINKTGLQDDSLFELSRSLRKTDIGDNDTYARKWLKFQQRFAELLPVLPLYSNDYYDFYNGDMQDYQIDKRSGWALGIIYVWMLDADTIVG